MLKMSSKKRIKLDVEESSVLAGEGSPKSNNEIYEPGDDGNIAKRFLEIELSLSSKLSHIIYSDPVSYVYNPIDYAYNVHAEFVNKFCNTKKKIMFLGMNPGPWGMSQTGVPFGEVNIVRDWLGISGKIGRPERENPAKPVKGFDCHRSEVSGQRFWGLFKELCSEASVFFQHTFVYNLCPLAFITESGRNISIPELKQPDRQTVSLLCSESLHDVLELFSVSVIVAVGKFAEKQALASIKSANIKSVKVVGIQHPSPRNLGNAGKWKEAVLQQLETLGLLQYYKQ